MYGTVCHSSGEMAIDSYQKGARAFLPIPSRGWGSSPIFYEFYPAFDQWQRSEEKLIVPVLLQPCEPFEDILQFPAVSFATGRTSKPVRICSPGCSDGQLDGERHALSPSLCKPTARSTT
jgi:hypothetical protein